MGLMWGLVPGQLDALQKTGGSTETDSVLPLKETGSVQTWPSSVL